MVDKVGAKTFWTFVITSIALVMVTLDNLVVTTAIPVIRKDLHASLQSPRMDGQRLHADVRRAPADRRCARRPLRPAATVRARARDLHRRLGVRRGGAVDRGAERGAGAAGRRRRDRHAPDADHPQRRGSA